MAWQTPKTNWKATDYINASDYNRIAGNLIALQTQALKIFGHIEYETMTGDKTYASLPHASDWNAVENNLATLNTHTYDYDIGATKTFYPNQAYINYAELNRIESASLRIKEQMDVHMALFPHLPIILGGAKPFGIRVSS